MFKKYMAIMCTIKKKTIYLKKKIISRIINSLLFYIVNNFIDFIKPTFIEFESH